MKYTEISTRRCSIKNCSMQAWPSNISVYFIFQVSPPQEIDGLSVGIPHDPSLDQLFVQAVNLLMEFTEDLLADILRQRMIPQAIECDMQDKFMIIFINLVKVLPLHLLFPPPVI